MLYTPSAKEMAKPRQTLMIDFLNQFFIESHAPKWQHYVQPYYTKTKE